MGRPRPAYLLAGRSSVRGTPDPLIQRVLREGLRALPRVAYVGVANGDDANFFHHVSSLLEEAGAGEVVHSLISSGGADLGEARRVIASADIVFLSGGDVDMGVRTLKEKNMVGVLRGVYEGGKLFFGSSAGSIMLAKSWVRWRDPADDSSAELFPCLGFAPIICDTHGEEDGWEELQVALKLARDGEVGYGIVSGAAVKVYSGGKVEALGGAVHRFVRREGKVIRVSDVSPIQV